MLQLKIILQLRRQSSLWKDLKKLNAEKISSSLSELMKSTYAKPERTQNTIDLRLDPDEPSGTVVNVKKVNVDSSDIR